MEHSNSTLRSLKREIEDLKIIFEDQKNMRERNRQDLQGFLRMGDDRLQNIE